MEKETLPYKQERLCFYIVGGESLKNCADLLKVTEMTVWRWLRLPMVADKIRELRRMVIESNVNDLLKLNKKAISTIEKLLDCDSPAARCRAAALVLTKTTESLEFEYESRLAAIEKRFNETK